ncbi:hypothetical protein LIER_41423 [Lithospermum erythrorhizon]|uniref:SAP domain-containing protein n=1 Tax=Lithospermum erythrorhizon TaxID=34254 RepID=A0AAV3RCB7_LITER
MDPKPPSPSSPTHGGAATFLSNLPSRGLFSTTTPSSTLGCTRVYICDHDTSPPQNQLIKTDQMNILIRSLLIKKHGCHVDTNNTRKRCHVDTTKSTSGSSDAKSAIKRVATGSVGSGSVDCLLGLTVERLRMMLREKGLSVKGKKDELIARLRTSYG